MSSLVPSGSPNPLSQYGQYGGAPWNGAPQAAPPAGPSVQQILSRSFAAVRRYWWLIAIVLVVGTVAGFALSKKVSPKYIVNGSIVIASRGPDRLGPVQAPGLLATEFGWPELARSFKVIDAVAGKLALYVTPNNAADTLLFRKLLPTDQLVAGRYRLTLDAGRSRYTLTRLADERSAGEVMVEQGAVGDSIGRPVGFAWQPQAALFGSRSNAFEFEVVTLREASLRIVKDLTINLPRAANIMQLELTGTNSGLLATTLNSIQRELLSRATNLKKDQLTQVRQTVETQLTEAAENLANAERALESYKISSITQPTENVAIAPGIAMAANPVFNSYFTDKTLHESTRRDREQLQRIIDEAKANGGRLSIEALRGAPMLVQNSPELSNALSELATKEANLRTLTETYTEEHERVRKERAAVAALQTTVIPQAATKLLSSMTSREQEMARRISGAEGELKKIPQRTIEEARLQRNVKVANDIYVDLQNRNVGANLAEQTALPDIQIYDTAVAPRFPTSDTRTSILVIAVLASLGVGLALAILLDRVDNRFRYPEQATGELGLDVIGAVPSKVKRRGLRQQLEQEAQFVESFRAIALNLRTSFPQGQLVQLTVSSPGPGDGKSTVSLNLSHALAQGGYRTLLIDGDTRRGTLYRQLPPLEQTPGLIDYLAGDATLAEVVKQTEQHPNLCLMPSGSRMDEGPQLLASQRMAQLLRELRSQFDAIIVDSAPLGAGIDAYALSSATGAMIMVLRAGETDRKLAEAKLSTLDRMPIRVLGAVLNDVGQSQEFRYYRYLDGYGVEKNQDTVLIGPGVSQEL